MKIRPLLVPALAFALGSCTGNKPELTSEGVSLELSQYRAETVSDIKYSLSFSIPEQVSDPVTGKEKLTFRLSGKKDVILDFTSSSYSSVLVNGTPAEPEYLNEHIVLPSELLKRGENSVEMDFISEDGFLNRNEEYLYTLFVPSHARSVFPCFDQPDLKAVFELSLDIPEGWKAVSNAAEKQREGSMVIFEPTQVIPTYLFSFAAGKWQTVTSDAAGRKMTAYYRETDPKKLAQFPDIFKEVGDAISYMEDFTGIPLPFSKYDFVIIPGFQFGGMEHPGNVFYNENTMFLNENPTLDEREKRINLIAHETSHMWFGDMVTMRWFDDVWTKEVYANYFAVEMTEPMFPEINHDHVWLKNYYVPAMADDRTSGTAPIRQRLDNLADAGLIYGNIIYDKAPIVMRDLVDYMGKDNFREGIREYLDAFAFGNASWDELIEILDRHSEKDIKGFSDVWVYQKGMPTVKVTALESGNAEGQGAGDSEGQGSGKAEGQEAGEGQGTDNAEAAGGAVLAISQSDPLGRGIVWPSKISILSDNGDTALVELSESEVTVPLQWESWYIPNADGRTYGLIAMDEENIRAILAHLSEIEDDTAREAALSVLHENYLHGNFTDASYYLSSLLDLLAVEKNAQVAAMVISQIPSPLLDLPADERAEPERRMLEIAGNHPLKAVHQQLVRSLASYSSSSDACDFIYRLWERENDSSLDSRDYTTFAYQLAIRMPEKAHKILARQRARLDGSDPSRSFNPDRLRQFDFVSRAALPEQEELDRLFADLLKVENRSVEPWAESALAYLNHFLRDEASVKYIRPGLDALQEIKDTGDIFFPASWCRALLGGHRSPAAYKALQSFLADNPDYPQLLKNKILLNSYSLERANR